MDENNKTTNEKAKLYMRKIYATDEGKSKIKLRYYLDMYGDNDDFTDGINNLNTYVDKLKFAKVYHYQKKIDNI